MMRRRARAGVLASVLAGTLAGVLPVLGACYVYAPLETSVPPVGETVALEITDRGRVGLAERLGPGVTRIEGRVVGNEGDDYIVNVARIEQLNGQSSQWSGEAMRLNRDFVGRVQSRKLSRTRTLLAAGVATAAVVALIASRGLFGSFTGDKSEPPPPPPPSFRPAAGH